MDFSSLYNKEFDWWFPFIIDDSNVQLSFSWDCRSFSNLWISQRWLVYKRLPFRLNLEYILYLLTDKKHKKVGKKCV